MMNEESENIFPQSYEAWETLRKLDYQAYRRKYMAFMAEIRNYQQCKNCPESRAWDDIRALPCGQFHCWVQYYC